MHSGLSQTSQTYLDPFHISTRMTRFMMIREARRKSSVTCVMQICTFPRQFFTNREEYISTQKLDTTVKKGKGEGERKGIRME